MARRSYQTLTHSYSHTHTHIHTTYNRQILIKLLNPRFASFSQEELAPHTLSSPGLTSNLTNALRKRAFP